MGNNHPFFLFCLDCSTQWVVLDGFGRKRHLQHCLLPTLLALHICSLHSTTIRASLREDCKSNLRTFSKRSIESRISAWRIWSGRWKENPWNFGASAQGHQGTPARKQRGELSQSRRPYICARLALQRRIEVRTALHLSVSKTTAYLRKQSVFASFLEEYLSASTAEVRSRGYSGTYIVRCENTICYLSQ